ncbi:MAG: Cof-type HAD-IIB family hydrolase [Paenibacillaceae bacterium]
MKNYRLIALDMDGTLLNKSNTISPENLYWIKKAGEVGVAVCLASGRTHKSIVPFMEQLELNTPVVAVNGSEVWQNKEQLYHRVLMDKDHVKEMYRLAKLHDIWFWASGLSQEYNRENWDGFPQDEQWLKFGYYIDNERLRLSIIKEISSWGTLEITNSDPNNMEMNPLGINKSYGIQKMCEIIGCTMSEVVAMGDSMNDLAMIVDAGLGVAMGNAQDMIKQAADVIAPTNEEDGVGFIIRKYVLGDQ